MAWQVWGRHDVVKDLLWRMYDDATVSPPMYARFVARQMTWALQNNRPDFVQLLLDNGARCAHLEFYNLVQEFPKAQDDAAGLGTGSWKGLAPTAAEKAWLRSLGVVRSLYEAALRDEKSVLAAIIGKNSLGVAGPDTLNLLPPNEPEYWHGNEDVAMFGLLSCSAHIICFCAATIAMFSTWSLSCSR